jgi:hypothetical protein
MLVVESPYHSKTGCILLYNNPCHLPRTLHAYFLVDPIGRRDKNFDVDV